MRNETSIPPSTHKRSNARTMRVTATAALTAAAVLLVLASQAYASAARTCRVRRCTTVSASQVVRVFRATTRHPAREVEYSATFAEWGPTGRVTKLGERQGTTTGTAVRALAVAGKYLVCGLASSTEEPGTEWQIERANIATGHRETLKAGVGFNSPFYRAKTGGVTATLVTPGGSIAWIDGDTETQPGIFEVVMALPGSGAGRVVASGASVEPRSLASAGRHVYWFEGGAARAESLR